MNETIVISLSIALFFSSLIGGAIYTDLEKNATQTARFNACISATQNPAECALASK